MTMEKEERIKSLEKALNLLLLLSRQDSPISLDNLRRLAGLSRTTCFRLLQTMQSLNFVERDPYSKGYRIGARSISIGAAALRNLSFRSVALPFMQDLRKETEETVILAVLDGNEIVVVEQVEGTYILSARLPVGSRAPVHCTATGKAILAYLPEPEVDRIMENIHFESRTDKTITSAKDFKGELEKVRAQGIAVNNEEMEKGFYANAAPILNHMGEPVAALSFAFPITRYSIHEAKRRNLTSLIQRASGAISAHLGFES